MSYNLFGHETAEGSPEGEEGVENELERELKEELDKLVQISIYLRSFWHKFSIRNVGKYFSSWQYFFEFKF